jgi:hypothetical protein
LPNYLDTDSDGDGWSDATEAFWGFDPYDPLDIPQLPLTVTGLSVVLLGLAGLHTVRNGRVGAAKRNPPIRRENQPAMTDSRAQRKGQL